MGYTTLFFVIGRVLFGGFFIKSGFKHFSNAKMLAGYAASKGVKSSLFAVLGTGALLCVGGLGVLLGVYVRWAVAALAIFLIGVSFTMHAFWKVADPGMKMSEQVNFNKNMALLGAAFMLLAIAAPWPFSL